MIKRLLLPIALLCSISSFLGASYDVMDFYSDYKKVIAQMYQGIDAIISDEERAGCTATGASPVYGEILYEGCAVLISELKLTADDVFYDLGSGLGKFITQVYLTTPVKKAWGIEFSENRYKRSVNATKNLYKIQTATFAFENSMRKIFDKDALEKVKGKKFGFSHKDMLKADLSDATVVFTCSTCFGPEFMVKLTDKLAHARDGLRILTLVQLPYNKHVHYITTYVLPMTWSAETPVYLYVVDRSREAEKPAAAQAEIAKEETPVSVARAALESHKQEQESTEDEEESAATLNLDMAPEDSSDEDSSDEK